MLALLLAFACIPGYNSPPVNCSLGAESITDPVQRTAAWVHPLAAFTLCPTIERGVSTGDLYRQAIALGVPIREWTFTRYHPDESSGKGGGWGTADGGGFRPECIACARRWWWYWRGHELWLQGHGRVVVGDNGPGWSGKYRFDLPGWSAAEVNAFDRGPGKETRRVVVIRCPRPETCDCDYAKAWRKHR